MAVQKKVATAKMPSSQKGKKKDGVDLAVDLLSSTLKFVKPNFKELFMRMLKINLFGFGVTMAITLVYLLMLLGVMIGFGLNMGALGSWAGVSDVFSNTTALVIIIALTTIFVVIISWVNLAFDLVPPILMNEQHTGKRTGLTELVSSMKMPALSYLLVSAAISLAALGIPAIALALLGMLGQTALFGIGIMVYIVWLLIFFLIFAFLSQFWMLEIAIAGRPVVESLRASVDLVKKNVLGVLVFDVLTIAVGMAIAIPFFVVLFIVEIVFRVGLFAGLMVPGANIVAVIAIVAFYVLIRMIAQIILIAAHQSTVLAYTYSYWKGIRE